MTIRYRIDSLFRQQNIKADRYLPDLQSLRYSVRSVVSNWFERPAISLLISLKISADGATFIGLIIAVISGYYISQGQFLLGGGLVLIGAIFDLLDGGIARSTGKVTKRGALTDSVFDRVSEIVILSGLGMYYVNAEKVDSMAVLLAFAAIGGSLMVSYVRARAEGLGVKGTAGFLTRPERIVITVTGLVLGYPLIVLWILGIGTPLSAIWRFLDSWRAVDN
ncbi:MAG: CDP-alcohol phosphatidyltransferase family protein [SAR202 cluster bacterium]|nr:CDP-diacylglycerol--glycerol-3-phosphate 3-phosphatidyltransferase [Chloroflexota bacterium]MQG88747.1 CDP-alcohol phosphatidyltransferase family protein [SAR202 cluster bacterium]